MVKRRSNKFFYMITVKYVVIIYQSNVQQRWNILMLIKIKQNVSQSCTGSRPKNASKFYDIIFYYIKPCYLSHTVS